MSVIQYAVAEDGTHLAYRVLEPDEQASDLDIVMVTGGLIPLEVFDDDPGLVRLLDGLRRIGRVIVSDRRGVGLSDPITDWERSILDQWCDDVAAVVDSAASGRAVVFGWDGFGIATRFAAHRPDAAERVVLFQPMGGDEESWSHWIHERIAGVWRSADEGGLDAFSGIAPSRANDPAFREWYERAGRVGASPATAARIWDSVLDSHPEETLANLRVPVLVIHRPNSTYVPPDAVRFVASSLPDATLVEVDGEDHWPFVGDVDAVVAEIADFVVGERRVPPPDRLLSAVLFTDLVDSTRRAAELGDQKWKSVLDRHDRAVRNAVGRCGGTVVKTTGDGVLALFPSAGAAVRSAGRLQEDLARDDDLAVRVGIHVGDIDRRGDDVSGLAVNIAARVMAQAGGGEIAVTASVVGSMAGEATVFESVGRRELKGVPGEWELFLCR